MRLRVAVVERPIVTSRCVGHTEVPLPKIVQVRLQLFQLSSCIGSFLALLFNYSFGCSAHKVFVGELLLHTGQKDVLLRNFLLQPLSLHAEVDHTGEWHKHFVALYYDGGRGRGLIETDTYREIIHTCQSFNVGPVRLNLGCHRIIRNIDYCRYALAWGDVVLAANRANSRNH